MSFESSEEQSSGRDPIAAASTDRAEAAPEVGLTEQGIWQLALPTMVAMSAGTVVRYTDFVMVRDLGPSALAAVGVGGQFYWFIESLGAIAPGGLTAILARAVGAGDRSLAETSFRQAHLLGAALGALGIAMLLPFTRVAIGFYGVEPDVIDLGSDYLWWRLWGTIPLSIAMIFGTALRAAGDVRTPLQAGIVAASVNVLMNWVLIHGNLGAPAMGVKGAALASNIALVVMAAHFMILWWSKALLLQPGRGSWRPDFDLQKRLLRIGIPSGAESGLFQLGLMLFQRIMSPFGTNVIAAYNVGSMLLGFSFIPGVAFSMAASTLVGQNLGAKRPDQAEKEGWRSNKISILTMSAVGGVLVFGARPIAGMFFDDPEAIDLCVIVLAILGAAHPFMAIEFALGGALRGAGDTLFPMITVFTGLVVVRLGMASGLVYFFDAGIQMVWSVLVVDYVLKSIMFVGRFRGGKWKRREV